MQRVPGGGFSILEAMLALGILASVGLVATALLDSTSDVLRAALDDIELAQERQIVESEVGGLLRRAGRGLGAGGRCLETVQQAGAGARVTGVAVLPGSDVIVVRGALSGPIWTVDRHDRDAWSRSPTELGLWIGASAPAGGAQDLERLLDLAEDAGRWPATPVLVGGHDGVVVAVGVVGIEEEARFLGPEFGEVPGVRVRARWLDPGDPADETWLELVEGERPGPSWNPTSVAVLEEVRIFARPHSADAERAALTRVWTEPGRDRALSGGRGRSWDLAESIADFQVALGRRDDLAGAPEWLWEDPGSADEEEWQCSELARVGVVLESDRRHRRRRARAVPVLENHLRGDLIEAAQRRRDVGRFVVASRGD